LLKRVSSFILKACEIANLNPAATGIDLARDEAAWLRIGREKSISQRLENKIKVNRFEGEINKDEKQTRIRNGVCACAHYWRGRCVRR
jgi:hypothetical protein